MFHDPPIDYIPNSFIKNKKIGIYLYIHNPINEKMKISNTTTKSSQGFYHGINIMLAETF